MNKCDILYLVTVSAVISIIGAIANVQIQKQNKKDEEAIKEWAEQFGQSVTADMRQHAAKAFGQTTL